MDPVKAYERMSPGDRRSVAMVEYVCASERSCHLLTIWQSPRGRYWYTPPYRLSSQTALSETAESARRKRTADGLRGWKARAGSLEDLIEFPRGTSKVVGLSLNCKHLRNEFISSDDLAADAADATPGAPRRIPIPRT